MFYVASEPSQRRRRLVDEILEDDQLLPPTPSNGLTHQSNGNTGTPAAPHLVPSKSTPLQPAPSTNISPGAQSPSNLNVSTHISFQTLFTKPSQVDATDSTGGKKDDPPHPVSSASTPPQPVSPVAQSSSNVNVSPHISLQTLFTKPSQVDATNSTGGKKDDPPHPVPSTSTPPQPVSPVAQSPSNVNVSPHISLQTLFTKPPQVDATNSTGGKKDDPPHPVPSTSTPPQPAPGTNVSPVAQSPSNLNVSTHISLQTLFTKPSQVDATNFTGGKKDNPYSGGGFFDVRPLCCHATAVLVLTVTIRSHPSLLSLHHRLVLPTRRVTPYRPPMCPLHQ